METVKQVQVKSGSTLNYVDVGQGVPIILIHGLFLDHTAFEQQIKAFAGQARIIAINIHGHGGSSVLSQPMSLDKMAEDYLDLAQQLEIQQAIWGGVSLGGMTSLRIAIRHPEYVLGLLLLNTSASAGEGKKVLSFHGLNAMLKLRFLWNTSAVKKQLLKNLCSPTSLEANPSLEKIWVERMKQISSISVKHSVEAVLNASSILDQLPSITVPTIVATGEDDTEFPMFMSQEIHQRISHSTLVEVENCGHSLPIEQPQRVNQLLEQLLAKVR
ncbi:alpha/beta hydrolase [Komarekiella sp. 'clone 1']|uniref:Alpha/beta hydrolase n=1 Tax=Komarekiella delphini-convector SJRDD-AB1 TaxID=2593771 RepID=A0AA40T4L9_9NOST|nr:alpha/beta hydrolase [Komarekiella delphini-convector]MBD6620824.1 alpha/beta hydrolase [Komarekiella delphini-convector SJRDD-AB1]